MLRYRGGIGATISGGDLHRTGPPDPRSCQPARPSSVSRLVRRVSILAACALALALPAAAGAQETNAPPGNSGIDEYLETVPSASGNRPAPPGGGPRTGQGAGRLPAVVEDALRDRGGDGRAVADLVRSAGDDRRGRPRDEIAGAKPSGPVAEPHGDSPLSSVVRAVGGQDGSGGMGAALPAILLGALAALAAVVVVRLGRRGSAS